MKQDVSELERLDTAARAEVAKASLRSQRWILGFLVSIWGALAIMSEAPNPETLVVRVLVVVAVVAALSSWLRWRYTLHVLAMFYFAMAIIVTVFDPQHAHSWVWRLGLPVSFVSLGYRLLKQGIPFAAAHGKAGQRERVQVDQWLKLLTNLGTEDSVYEISTGNFWVGYCNYRFMKRDEGWAVVRLKRGNYLRPLDYRILPAGSVTITQLPGGKFYVQMGKRTLREVSIDPDMQASLLRLTSAN